jgi:2OG-Fe(II) oxygenase superfamily
MTNKIIQALVSGDSGGAINAAMTEADDSWFCAELPLPTNSLCVTVDGIGTLPMPLTRETIHQLIGSSSDAQFGFREQTLLNKTVRDTKEIHADKLTIEHDEVAMADMLAKARKRLGLPESAQFEAHLHNLLIYGPGQFFKPHQDSEKLPGMVATLVVVLPSPHIGGMLRLDHNDGQYFFETENLDQQDLQCFVFYADCRHEVHPIKQGYRVSLTYNLVLTSDQPRVEAAPQFANPALQQALSEFFPPNQGEHKALRKFAFFLDHQYTEHGLRWNLLKGADHQHAQAFCHAAQKLDLVIHLGLVEIHQSWTAEGDETDPEPEELIDSETSLTFAVDLHNNTARLENCYLHDAEIGWLTALDKEDFFNSEFEGWTGNAGQTVDYWYRRAAVVLWLRADDIQMQLMHNYSAALAGLVQLTKQAGNEAQLAASLAQAGVMLHKFSRKEPISEHLKALAQVALYLKDEGVALSCLDRFGIPDVTEDCATALINLQQVFGTAWCLQLLALWAKNGDPNRVYDAKAVNIDRLVRDLLAANSAATATDLAPLAGFLAHSHLAHILSEDSNHTSPFPVALVNVTAHKLHQMTGLILATAALADGAMAETIVQHLIDHRRLYAPLDLAEVLLSMQQSGASNTFGDFARLRKYVLDTIMQEKEQGLRAKDDWAIVAEAPCHCLHCQPVMQFLLAKNETQARWGMAEKNRRHVVYKYGELGLPLDFTVLKEGSPHKLVASKNPRLHLEAQARYERVLALAAQLGVSSQ